MIDKTTIIYEAIEQNKNIIKIFEKYGMKCATCSMRFEETVEIGAKSHNIDVETLLNEINKCC